MNRSAFVWLLFVQSGFLSGCFGIIENMEYEYEVGAFIPVNWLHRLGESEVRFGKPIFSHNTIAMGLGAPTIPAPGKGDAFEDDPLYVTVTYRPAPYRPAPGRLLVLNLDEYLILVDDSSSPLAPTNWTISPDVSGCDIVAEPPNLRVHDKGCTVRLYYDIKMSDVHRFTLIPAPIYTGEVPYAFPNIDYERGTYTSIGH